MNIEKIEAKSKENADNRQEILGVRVNRTHLNEVLKRIQEEKLFLVSVNPEYVMQAQKDKQFREVLNSADLALPDGVGLKLAVPDLEIIPGRKLVEELLKHKYKFFFLGGRDGVAQAMAQKYGGDFDPGEEDIANPKRNAEILAKINGSHSDILLVAYTGSEKWLWANRSSLDVRVMMGIGGTFDYLTGRTKLPPEWVADMGLEWFWRLIQEPWRWRRQLNLVRFVLAIAQSSFK